jgi:transcriptional regulator with XRE-family HTH domain
MTRLDELLGAEYEAPDARLYLALAREDQNLLAELIEIRRQRATQEQVAEILGVSQATVSAFERLGNDPKLSTIRRYAKAIGVMIAHHVDPDPSSHTTSQYISHVTDAGVTSARTAAALARDVNRHAAKWPVSAAPPADVSPSILARDKRSVDA